MKQLNNKSTSILRKKIWPWKIIHLPFWWYRTVLNYIRVAIREIKKGDSVGTGYLHYSIRLAVCCNNRQYIDEAIQQTKFDAWPQNYRWQAFFDIGMAFYDLGYRKDGIDYIERALAFSDFSDPQNVNYSPQSINYYSLCCRLSEMEDWDRRLRYGLDFEKKFPQEDELTNIIFASSYIDLKEFEKASQIVQDLIGVYPGYNTFLAELLFSKGSFQQAADIFDKYSLDKSQDYRQYRFDYKKAIAYFKSNQTRKWHNTSEKIGRRLAWDKFYTLDYLESEGVERIPEIDEVIERSKNRKRVIYVDKIIFALKRTPWMMWETFSLYFCKYWYVVSIVLAVSLILLQFFR
jgi:hypothetical protein